MTFDGFTFGGEVLLGRIAGFYGFPVPESDTAVSVADFVRARLRHPPILGDRVGFQDIELTVRGLDGGRITRIGVELGPA